MLRTHCEIDKGPPPTSNESSGLQFPACDDDRLTVVKAPEGRGIEVKPLLGQSLPVRAGWGRPNLSDTTGDVYTCTGANQAVVVPVQGARYILEAMGATVYVTAGATAAAGVAGMVIPESTMTEPMEIWGAPVGDGTGLLHIIGTAGAFFYLVPFVD